MWALLKYNLMKPVCLVISVGGVVKDSGVCTHLFSDQIVPHLNSKFAHYSAARLIAVAMSGFEII